MTEIFRDGDLSIELNNDTYRISKLVSGTMGLNGNYQVVTFSKNDIVKIHKAATRDETLKGYVTREKNGRLLFSISRPGRWRNRYWMIDGSQAVDINQDMFHDLKWEDNPLPVDVFITPESLNLSMKGGNS